LPNNEKIVLNRNPGHYELLQVIRDFSERQEVPISDFIKPERLQNSNSRESNRSAILNFIKLEMATVLMIVEGYQSLLQGSKVSDKQSEVAAALTSAKLVAQSYVATATALDELFQFHTDLVVTDEQRKLIKEIKTFSESLSQALRRSS